MKFHGFYCLLIAPKAIWNGARLIMGRTLAGPVRLLGFFYFDQVSYFTYHTQHLRRGLQFARRIGFVKTQSLQRQLLALGAIDGTFDQCYLYLLHVTDFIR